MMDNILDSNEVSLIAEKSGLGKTLLDWSLKRYSDEVVGYLGEHLRLVVSVETNESRCNKSFFVKSMPISDEWKSKYLENSKFFLKEYVMLADLFEKFKNNHATQKWRPSLIYIKQNVFVFEDVTSMGYKMPNHTLTMSYDEIIATIKTMVEFHARSYIFEENRSKELNRPYRIWEDYSEYLQEPANSLNWRVAGRKAVQDFLLTYSKYKLLPQFSEKLDTTMKSLFETSFCLMNPSSKYRNVVVHRDLWSNNIFLNKDNGNVHALIVDFQTVLYCPPMLDLASFIYFNSTQVFRDIHTEELIDFYYLHLKEVLTCANLDVEAIISKTDMHTSYEEFTLFALIQASLIVPITNMDDEYRQRLFDNPSISFRINEISRSAEIVDVAKNCERYCNRLVDLFDEIVERYIINRLPICKPDNKIKLI